MLWPFLMAMFAQSSGLDSKQIEGESESYVIADVATEKSKCSQRNARRVTFGVLATQPLDSVHGCIVVRGFLRGNALFQSEPDSRIGSSAWSRALRDRRLGLYGLGKAVPGARLRPGNFDIVGVVGDCDHLRSGVDMVMGYCHYFDGRYIAASDVRRIR